MNSAMDAVTLEALAGNYYKKVRPSHVFRMIDKLLTLSLLDVTG